MKVTTFKNVLNLTLISLSLFMYIYGFKVKYIPVSSDKIALLATLLIAAMYARDKICRIYSNRIIIQIILVLIVYIIYTFSLDCMVVDGFKVTYHALLFLIEYQLFPILLVCLFWKCFGSELNEKFMNCIFICIVIQSSLGYMMLFSADFKSSVYMWQYGTIDVHNNLFLRGNGISSGLFFSAPVLASIFSVVYLHHQKKFSLLIKTSLLLFILLISITNARSSLIPAIVYFALNIVRNFTFLLANKNIKIRLFYIKNLFFPLLLLAGGIVVVWLFGSKWSLEYEQILEIIQWVVGGYANLFGLSEFQGKETIVQILLTQTSIQGNFWSILFGTGENAFMSLYSQSDIGVINLLRFGGLIYFVFSWFVLFWIGLNAVRLTENNIMKDLIRLSLFCYPILSLKAIVVGEQLLGRFIMLICVFAIASAILASWERVRELR